MGWAAAAGVVGLSAFLATTPGGSEAVRLQSTAAVTVSSGTVYQLVARHSGKALSVAASQAGATAADGAATAQQPAQANATSEQFHFVATGDGYYRITALNGKVLDVYGASVADGTAVVEWSPNGGQNQQWSFKDLGTGYVNLINRGSGKLLDVFALGTTDGTKIIQWTSNGGANQQWQLATVGQGTTTIPTPVTPTATPTPATSSPAATPTPTFSAVIPATTTPDVVAACTA